MGLGNRRKSSKQQKYGISLPKVDRTDLISTKVPMPHLHANLPQQRGVCTGQHAVDPNRCKRRSVANLKARTDPRDCCKDPNRASGNPEFMARERSIACSPDQGAGCAVCGMRWLKCRFSSHTTCARLAGAVRQTDARAGARRFTIHRPSTSDTWQAVFLSWEHRRAQR
jgi:hypothetical protein